MIYRLLSSLALLFALFPACVAAADRDDRPVLQIHQGNYFRYSVPVGWRANETMSGLDLFAPDGATGASFSLLMGGFGQATPEGYIQFLIKQLGLHDARVLSIRRLPSEPGPGGFPWQIAEAELAFTYKGRPVKAYVQCGVVQGWNQYSVVTRSFQAPVEDWKIAGTWLPAVMKSVIITNPRQVSGLDQVQLPRNIPHDEIYGSYNQAWQSRQVPSDRISQAQQEGTMGYERMRDPETGQFYDMPLGAYDATVGGYRNPRRPTELLQKAAPGE